MRSTPLLVLLAALVAVPAQAAAAPQSGRPELREATVTIDRHHRAVVDVVAELPDASGLAGGATNSGRVRFTLRGQDGATIATGSDTVDLPVDVQRSNRVVQTFRVRLGAAASRRVRQAGAETTTVEATVQSVVDANGAEAGGVSSVRASDTLDVDVDSGAVPSRWQYFQSNFHTDSDSDFGFTTCNLSADNCQINFRGGDQPATPPFSQQGVDGTLSYNRWDSDPADMRSWSLSLHTGSHEGLLHGYTAPDYSKAELPITSGIVRDWGSEKVRSGTTGAVAEPGGPLYISVEFTTFPAHYTVHIWGYLRCEDVDCTIPALEQPR